MFDFDVITGPTPPRQDERRSAAAPGAPLAEPPSHGGRELGASSPSPREGESRGRG
jgi:hypothetical protein